MSSQLNDKIIERGSLFLQSADVITRMDQQTQLDIKAGKKEFAYYEVYVRYRITSVGTLNKITDTSQVKKNGVTNLNNAKHDDGVVAAVTNVGLSYGFHATKTDVADIQYSSSEYYATIPEAIKNAEISVKNGNKAILNCRTKRLFSNSLAEIGLEASGDNDLALPQPKYVDNAPYEIIIDTTNMPALPSGNHFVEVRLTGVKVIDRTSNK